MATKLNFIFLLTCEAVRHPLQIILVANGDLQDVHSQSVLATFFVGTCAETPIPE